MPSAPGSSLARSHSRRPRFLRNASAQRTLNPSGARGAAPASPSSKGLAKRMQVTIIATGLPGSPTKALPAIWPSATGRPGRMASRQKCSEPIPSSAARR